MQVIEYDEKYDNDIKSLLEELQRFIVSLDIDGYNVITEDYREKYFIKTIEEVNKYEGKIYLAEEDGQILGLIVGLINNEEIDTYDFKAPKRGRITELIVKNTSRKKGIGQILMDSMEAHFKECGCKAILLDVFSFNKTAIEFYIKNGYHNRTEEMLKKI